MLNNKTQWYIERAKLIHQNKYDYSLVKNVNSNKEKIVIICPNHGQFVQCISNHINAKQGCGRCNGRYTKTKEEVLAQIKDKHGDKYSYVDFEYTGNIQKIEIICQKHGIFKQVIKEHINGSGCPQCNKACKQNTSSFIEKAKVKHDNKYDYSLVDYRGSDSEVRIVCPSHGEFSQTPHGHLMGYGCRRCVANSSKMENEWLDSFQNKYIIRQFKLKLDGKNYNLDGFDPTTNTIYEFYGSFFHGHPDCVDWLDNKAPKMLRMSYKELYNKTIIRQKELEKNGYSVIYIWEHDFLNQKGKAFQPKFKTEDKNKRRMDMYRSFQSMVGFDSDEDYSYILTIP